MGGLDFQHKLIQARVQISIIFITADADVPMSVKAMKFGAVEFLTKPFRDQDLLDVLQHALGNATGLGAIARAAGRLTQTLRGADAERARDEM
jgi:FixJ family two-component response regulator